MDKAEIIKVIDDGANFYCRILGDASHMEFRDNGYYSIIYPKDGEKGGTSLFDVRIEQLSDKEANLIIDEIKSKKVHTWWGLCVSDRIADLIWGKYRPTPPASEDELEEAYMALFPNEKPVYRKFNAHIEVRPVSSLEEFNIWADICNSILHGNFSIIHPVNHYHLCEKGIMPCFIGYYNNTPASVSAIINDKHNSSLEFVATLDNYRDKGLATALCQTAVDNAFLNGSKIITARAFNDAIKLYKSLGFKIYN